MRQREIEGESEIEREREEEEKEEGEIVLILSLQLLENNMHFKHKNKVLCRLGRDSNVANFRLEVTAKKEYDCKKYSKLL